MDKNVTIIVPVYNAENYIERCIESIINQTYKNLEIILINDGSKDNSLKIINDFANKDKRIKVISKKNSGPSRTRNRGIEEASGRYIAFIDADDYVSNNYIEVMIDTINEAQLSICNHTEESNIGISEIDIFKFITVDGTNYNMKVVNEIISGLGGLVWGKLFDKNIIDNNKIRFDENFKMSEDLLFVLEFVNRCSLINKTNEHLYFHNKINNQSITYNYDSSMFFKQIEVQNEIKRIMLETKFNNDLNNMLNNRLKDIVMYSSYKEVISKKSFNEKINNIDSFIKNQEIINNCRYFTKNGPIDRVLVNAIIKKKAKRVYLLTKLRTVALDIYNKVKKVRG